MNATRLLAIVVKELRQLRRDRLTFSMILGIPTLQLLLFGFAMIWLGIWVGSLMRTVEAVQGLMFTVMFPLTFVANTFAPTENMPDWLRTVAEWNPVSSLTQACRELWGNAPAAPADATKYDPEEDEIVMLRAAAPGTSPG
mgnify:CR=1 FL=1